MINQKHVVRLFSIGGVSRSGVAQIVLETRALRSKPRLKHGLTPASGSRNLLSKLGFFWFVIRYHKCLSCYEKLIAIRAILLKKQSTTPGKLGASFRDLAVLIRGLEWLERCRLWGPREFETTDIDSPGTGAKQRQDRATISWLVAAVRWKNVKARSYYCSLLPEPSPITGESEQSCEMFDTLPLEQTSRVDERKN